MVGTASELTVLGTLTFPGRKRSVAHARRFVRDEPDAEDGRGLLIVAAVADEWGAGTDTGTMTWFRIHPE